MASTRTRAAQKRAYERAARQYLASLPPEHFMESIPQATQREITLASLALVKARRPEVHVFNELLVQYPVRGRHRPGQVCPDNMVVVTDETIEAVGSYNTPFEATRPFWALEYVSRSNQRQDYEDNFEHYEQRLKVPYYLIFRPDLLDFILYRHTGTRYREVRPNAEGRYAIPELDLEVGLRDGWVRFWYHGELLQLPADLQRELDDARRQAEEAKRLAETANQRADEAKEQADVARRQADQAKRQADDLSVNLTAEREARQAAERELAQLRAELERKKTAPQNHHGKPQS